MTSTTQRLAEFVVGLRFADVPPEVIVRVKRQSLDLFGVALAGSAQEAAVLARRFVERQQSKPESSVWGSVLRASPSYSAFANGIAAHALDFDDMWLPSAHPTAPTLPATLALGESLGASGQALLVAQLTAYEVMGKLSSAVGGRAGWHTTAIFGCIAATTACAKLLGLNERQTAMAWGIASSEASGVEGHSGTMTKPFHAGQAARSGVEAALLAADGFTASDRVFDGGHGGFFGAFYRDLQYTARQDLPKSHWRYPLSRDEWEGKYRANAGRVLAPQRVEQLRERVEQLEAVPDVRELGGLLGTD